MTCRSDEEDADPPQPGFTTPTKAYSNDWACHRGSDAEGTKSESDADVEKEFDESTGKTRKYSLYLNYTEVKRWYTGSDSILVPTQVNHEIYTLMKKFMQQSCLMKAPPLRDIRSFRLTLASGSSIVWYISPRELTNGSEL